MNQFLLGFLTAVTLTIAIFFLRFFHERKDRLFGYFAAAFGVLAMDWVAQAFVSPRHEQRHLLFLFRLVAFLLIIAGIIDKNRSR
jgi:hypothetical protein